jgi:glutathione S-transferase
VPQTVSDCFRLIEREMFAGPWVMGDRYSICDPYLFTLTQWLDGDGVDVKTLPKIHDHFGRMSARRAVQAALAQQTA